ARGAEADEARRGDPRAVARRPLRLRGLPPRRRALHRVGRPARAAAEERAARRSGAGAGTNLERGGRKSMKDVLGYAGKQVVITGCATGMGAAAAELLVGLGAEVHALDIGEVAVGAKQVVKTDMKSKASIDAAIAKLPV